MCNACQCACDACGVLLARAGNTLASFKVTLTVNYASPVLDAGVWSVFAKSSRWLLCSIGMAVVMLVSVACQDACISMLCILTHKLMATCEVSCAHHHHVTH
jgi:hypothetical protein